MYDNSISSQLAVVQPLLVKHYLVHLLLAPLVLLQEEIPSKDSFQHV